MLVTLADVAARAGVSRSAVSRTFTTGASVSERMRKKVETAARELGYTPNVIARSLSTNRTQLVGVICTNFHNPYLLEVFELVTHKLQDENLRPLLVNLAAHPDPEQAVDMLRQYRVDAVIICSSTLPEHFARSLINAGLVTVHMFGRCNVPGVNVVGINNQRGGEIAAQGLLDSGYKKPAFLGGPANATSTQDRATGFASKLNKAHAAPVIMAYAENYSYNAGFQRMRELLSEHPDIDCVFCGDDVIAMGALSASRGLGRVIPEELGLIGFNDMSMAAWDGVELSTIQQPTGSIVGSAVELVKTLLKNPDHDYESRVFSCQLLRRSTLRTPLPRDKNHTG